MNTLRKKLTSITIIFLGILITTPTLFAQQMANRRMGNQNARAGVYQNTGQRQHPNIQRRRLRIASFLANLRRRMKMMRARRYAHRKAYRKHNARQHNRRNNYNNRGYGWNRP